MEVKEYFSKRFSEHGRVWGEAPSLSAIYADELFAELGVKSILVPGSGYGRHTIYFNGRGYDVEGIEITDEGIALACCANPEIVYYKGSVLDMPFSDKKYDAVFCFNVLHLFQSADREKFIANCKKALKDGGYIFFTSASEQDKSFGMGVKTEENTYESKPGRPVHYFSEKDMGNSFAGFEILDTGIMDEYLGQEEVKQNAHRIRYVFAKNK